MAKKQKGHSKKKRHSGVGVPAQGKHLKSKTNVLGRKKKPEVELPKCHGESLQYARLVSGTGKVEPAALWCKTCGVRYPGDRMKNG